MQSPSDTSLPGSADPPRRGRGRQLTSVPESLRPVYEAYRDGPARAAESGESGAPPADQQPVDRAEDGRVRAFLAWVERALLAGELTEAALTDPTEGVAAAGAYRVHLREGQGIGGESVSRHLGAVTAFYQRRGVNLDGAARAGGMRRRGAEATELPDTMRAVFEDYHAKLTHPAVPLDADSKRAYASRVRQYLAWLAAALDDGAIDGDPLSDQNGATWAARDYRTHLMTVLHRKPETVNAHLSALGDFYARRALAAPDVARQQLPNHAPRALDPRDRVRLQRSAEQASPRDRSIALCELLGGLRIGEIAALDLGDVHLSACRGEMTVRYGKGGKYRTVPVHPKLRTVLEQWLRERAAMNLEPAVNALFVNRFGTRLSVRAAYDAVIKIARRAGLVLGRDAPGGYTPTPAATPQPPSSCGNWATTSRSPPKS